MHLHPIPFQISQLCSGRSLGQAEGEVVGRRRRSRVHRLSLSLSSKLQMNLIKRHKPYSAKLLHGFKKDFENVDNDIPKFLKSFSIKLWEKNYLIYIFRWKILNIAVDGIFFNVPSTRGCWIWYSPTRKKFPDPGFFTRK